MSLSDNLNPSPILINMKPIVLVSMSCDPEIEEEETIDASIYCSLSPLYLRYMQILRESDDHFVDKGMTMGELQDAVANARPGDLILLAKMPSRKRCICAKVYKLIGLD